MVKYENQEWKEKFLYNDKFRLKVTDKCNLQCCFCHSEGAANAFDIDIHDKSFIKAISMLRDCFSRVHITGGEPTLHQNLKKIVDILCLNGYEVSMTSNGLFSVTKMRSILEKLSYVNLSIHSFNPEFVALHMRNPEAAQGTVSALKKNIRMLREILPVKINTVVSNKPELQKLQDLIEYAGTEKLELKLVPEWKVRFESRIIIDTLLKTNGFEPFELLRIVPGSNVRKRYKDEKGQIIELKDIDFFQPEFLCSSCKDRKICQEGFSFLRIEDCPVRLRICIFQNSLDLTAFTSEMMPQLMNLYCKTKEEHKFV